MDKFSLDDICTLVAVTLTRNTDGEEERTETERVVYCKANSVGSNEFFKAQQTGMRSSICLIVDSEEYANEPEAVYNGTGLSIYRTYVRGDGFTELYLEDRAGVSDSE